MLGNHFCQKTEAGWRSHQVVSVFWAPLWRAKVHSRFQGGRVGLGTTTGGVKTNVNGFAIALAAKLFL